MYATLPELDYDITALEPFIDARTMQIHHDKHHALYVDKLNSVMDKHAELAKTDLKDLMKNLTELNIDEADKTLIKNHGGGHLNHSLFWSILGPKKDIDEVLTQKIMDQFSSITNFKSELTQAGLNRFGSGWAWLVESNGKLKIYSTANQDSPYLQGDTPLIGIDVWEHAYYLKYQNLRADYIEAFFKVLKIID
jgi:Fe-Mn family superoxide dismutase